MAFRSSKRKESLGSETSEKVLDVDAAMQGSLTFRDPVNLRINGKFEGTLDTKGRLTIGEAAEVHANINGENIVISGEVHGDVIASTNITLTQTARLFGNIKTPRLSISAGALFQGKSSMQKESKAAGTTMDVKELSSYLEIETSSLTEWANNGKIPAMRQGSSWRFNKADIDSWLATQKG